MIPHEGERKKTIRHAQESVSDRVLETQIASVPAGEALEVHLNLIRTIFVFDTHGHRGCSAFVDFDKLIGALLVRRIRFLGRETLRFELIVIKFGNIVNAARGCV
jgi:hypothetical protein